ncbi:hypothetical protein ACSHWG_02645 [Leucobacter sp. Z1108]|uniref:hypothetical protein n=1 Tax=Leucobacter sp. Z1108 TaxID=3439066 RepID=UPI003F39ED88
MEKVKSVLVGKGKPVRICVTDSSEADVLSVPIIRTFDLTSRLFVNRGLFAEVEVPDADADSEW